MNTKISQAYWLSPKGKIYDVNISHIDYIFKNPEIFKLTTEKIKEIYRKHKEPFGWEGKARKEILIDVMKRGWVRIRDYKDKGWSVEVWELDNYAKELIYNWAAKVKGLLENKVYNQNNINIHIIKLEQEGKPRFKWFIETNFDEIIKGKLEENKIMKYEEYLNEM